MEQGVILVLDHPFYLECQHVDVDRDDRFRFVYQWEHGFSGQDTFGGPVSPEHSGEFLCPFAFSFAQNFAQVVQDGAVADFGLVIALRLIW